MRFDEKSKYLFNLNVRNSGGLSNVAQSYSPVMTTPNKNVHT